MDWERNCGTSASCCGCVLHTVPNCILKIYIGLRKELWHFRILLWLWVPHSALLYSHNLHWTNMLAHAPLMWQKDSKNACQWSCWLTELLVLVPPGPLIVVYSRCGGMQQQTASYNKRLPADVLLHCLGSQRLEKCDQRSKLENLHWRIYIKSMSLHLRMDVTNVWLASMSVLCQAYRHCAPASKSTVEKWERNT